MCGMTCLANKMSIVPFFAPHCLSPFSHCQSKFTAASTKVNSIFNLFIFAKICLSLAYNFLALGHGLTHQDKQKWKLLFENLCFEM